MTSRYLALIAVIVAFPVARGDDKKPTESPDVLKAMKAYDGMPFGDAKPKLTKSLDVRQPTPVQLAALRVLARYESAQVPALVLAAWPSLTPQLRAVAIETLLSRPAWVSAFLDAVEKKVVLPMDLEPARVQALQKSPDEKVRARAVKLFVGAPSKQQDTIAKYRKALDRKGDIAKGKAIFKESCAACHKLEGVGEAVGPDLTTIKDRSAELMLIGILDPNREVLPQYSAYLLVTDDDRIFSGMIAAETATAITLRKTDGMSETVNRADIQSLRSTGLSAMPEGFEEKIDPAAMADLLAYLTSIK